MGSPVNLIQNTTQKNLLINGNFDYWQRGINVVGASRYGADRWRGNSAIASQERANKSFSAGLPAGSQFGNLVTSAAGGGSVAQRIESRELTHLVGQYLTLSFRAGLVTGSTQMNARVRKPTATDNWASSTVVFSFANLGIPAAHTGPYTLYSGTFLVDQDMADKGISLEIEGDATVWSIMIAQAMLVVADGIAGLIPNKYVYAGQNLIQELALCQRYYEITGIAGETALASGSQTGVGFAPWKVEKRATPIVDVQGNSTPNSMRNANTGATVVGLNLGPSVYGTEVRFSGAQSDNVMFTGTIYADAEL